MFENIFKEQFTQYFMFNGKGLKKCTDNKENILSTFYNKNAITFFKLKTAQNETNFIREKKKTDCDYNY